MRKPLILALTLMIAAALPAVAGWDEGVAAFKAKNYQAAAQEFQQVVAQNPDGYRGYYMLGLSQEQLGRKEEALTNLRRAYDANPNEVSIKLALGRAYRSMRRYSDAASLLGTVDGSALPAEQKVVFYQIRGEAFYRTNNVSRAVQDFKQLAALKPNDAQVQKLYGTAALAAGDSVAGVAALGKASQLAPNDAEIGRTYVNALIKQGRESRDKAAKKQAYTKAAGAAKSLAAKNATYDNLMLQVSAELGAGLYNEAAASGQKAIAKKGDDWLAHYYVGQAFTSAGRVEQAEAPLRSALSLAQSSSDKSKVWKQLGYSYEKQKEYAKSIEAYEKAGDPAGVARVKKNQETADFNEQVEEENRRIKEMEVEAKRLEEEMKALEEGGGLL